MNTVLQWLDRTNERLARFRAPNWLFPAFLALIGTATLVVSAVFNPAADEHVELWGHPWPGLCGFLMMFGRPCPQCGMTRAWIAMARGHWLTGLHYSPAGATLWLTLVIAGVVGWVRLVTGRPYALEPPRWLLIGWLGIWMFGLYAGAWVLRAAFDVNHLAHPQAVEQQLRDGGLVWERWR